MSMVPDGRQQNLSHPWLVDNIPDAYINMGLGTENIARKFVSRVEQADQFSADSHKNLSPPLPPEISRTKSSRRSENHLAS